MGRRANTNAQRAAERFAGGLASALASIYVERRVAVAVEKQVEA
jgi:hypothetical protein